MALVLKSKKTMALIEDQKKKGTRTDYFKPDPNEKGVFKVFVCPPAANDEGEEKFPIVQKVVIHEAFTKSQGKLGGCVSPANWEEKDPFMKLGWSLKKKYEKHAKKSVKEFYKYLTGKTKNIMYVIDPSDIEKGIQVYQAPKDVVDFVLNHIDINDGDMDFAHPQTGKFLIIKKSGEGLATKYDCGWSKNPCDMDLEEDKLEELLSGLPDTIIGTMFKKPTKEDLDEYKDVVDGLAEKLGISINWKNTKDSNLEVDDEVEGEEAVDGEEEETSKGDEDLDLEDDEVEAPKKPAAKPAAKVAAPAKGKDAKPAAKTAAKPAAKPASKAKVLDDELDIEDDENSSSDELDLEDDE